MREARGRGSMGAGLTSAISGGPKQCCWLDADVELLTPPLSIVAALARLFGLAELGSDEETEPEPEAAGVEAEAAAETVTETEEETGAAELKNRFNVDCIRANYRIIKYQY
jgi:hypothetical protein